MIISRQLLSFLFPLVLFFFSLMLELFLILICLTQRFLHWMHAFFVSHQRRVKKQYIISIHNVIIMNASLVLSLYLISKPWICWPAKCPRSSWTSLWCGMCSLFLLKHVVNDTCLHTYIHTYIHTCIHAYIHTYIHKYTYIHTYIHTYIR